MSSEEPNKPYVYQPFGTIAKTPSEQARVRAGRIYGVGLPWVDAQGMATIKGLTKPEAEAVCEALATLPTNTQDGKAPPPSKRGND